MELSDIPQELLIARGEYATIRAEHEEEKKRLQVLCGQLSAVSSQVLRTMQPDNSDAPDILSVLNLLDHGRNTIDSITTCADRINYLARQRAELRPKAWPHK